MTTYEDSHSTMHRGWGVSLLGWLCILLGLVLTIGGVWLIALGGSWYYGLAGVGLITTGALLNRRSMAAVWVYLLVWAGTVAWAWWEVGPDWWAQLPRLLAPSLVLLFVLISIPRLVRRP